MFKKGLVQGKMRSPSLVSIGRRLLIRLYPNLKNPLIFWLLAKELNCTSQEMRLSLKKF